MPHKRFRITREWLHDHYVSQRMSLAQCSAALGVSAGVIRNWLVRYGIPRHSPGSQPGDNRQARHAIAWLRDRDWIEQKYAIERMTCAEIARLLHVHESTVFGWLKRHGIERRLTGPGRNRRVIASEQWRGGPYES